MKVFCKLFGHTWVHKTSNPKIRWSTNAKSLAELDLSAEGESALWLECQRCGAKNENPTREEIKRAC